MEITEEECKRMLDMVLEDRLYEVDFCGHIALIGKRGYIDYLLRDFKISRILKEIDKEYGNE